MARIVKTCDIRLEQLVIGANQVRTRRRDEAVNDLVESIRLHGLLEPIVVCASSTGGYFEVLMGQRRMLAHQRLGLKTIRAVVIDTPLDATTAKVLSLTENLIRRELDRRDVIDACTILYHKYGSAQAVADETGLPYSEVLKHIKYERLGGELRTMVDTGEIELDVALKAQDATSVDGTVDQAEAKDFAEALATMTSVQKRQVLRAKHHNPGIPVRALVQEVWRKDRSRQIVVTVSEAVHKRLQAYARAGGMNQDEAAAGLLAASLTEVAPPVDLAVVRGS